MKLLYLDAAAVCAAMPPVDVRIALARRTMIALAGNAELPPKIGVHPRDPDSFTSAMPALLRGAEADGTGDLLGIKWVTAYPENRSRGIDAVHATVILNDPETGVPVAILDGGPITAERTAAVSGVALTEWWPRPLRDVSVTLVGAGVQGRSHLEILAHVATNARLQIADRDPDQAAALGEIARNSGIFASVETTSDLVAAVSGADVVLTMISFGTRRQIVPLDAFADASLIVAVDYDMCVPAEVARGSGVFLVDDRAQFDANRHDAVFAGYPEPDASIGEALLGKAPARRPPGPTFVSHLGVGLADVVFADAIVREAQRLGIGTTLPG